MGPEERRTHSTSAFELPSASRTNKRWGGPLSYLRQQFQKGGLASATTWTHSAEQAIRKGAYPKANPTLASVSHGTRVSAGTHAYPVRMFVRCPRFTRRPCSPDVHVSPNAHAYLVLMFHPILEGDRSGTYRARTLEINPPWQETCNMHDFGTPDAK